MEDVDSGKSSTWFHFQSCSKLTHIRVIADCVSWKRSTVCIDMLQTCTNEKHVSSHRSNEGEKVQRKLNLVNNIQSIHTHRLTLKGDQIHWAWAHHLKASYILSPLTLLIWQCIILNGSNKKKEKKAGRQCTTLNRHTHIFDDVQWGRRKKMVMVKKKSSAVCCQWAH